MRGRIILTFVFLLSFGLVFSQNQITDTIRISYTKSAYLIFNDNISFFDKGSDDVLIRQEGNKLIIQSELEKGFKETNLFVQSGSEIYLFILSYVEKPKKFLYNYQTSSTNDSFKTVEPKSQPIARDVQVKKEEELLSPESQKKLHETNCLYAASKKQSIYDKGQDKEKIKFIATNLFIDENYFYLTLYVKNTSKIKYDINFIRLTIKNRDEGLNKAAEQIIKVPPVYILNDSIKTVDEKNAVTFVYVIKKFTIEDYKKLNIELNEKNGDRNLQIDFYSKDILNAKSINLK